MIFANIEYLFLLVLLIPYIVWYVMKRKKTEPTLQVSTTRMYMKAPKSWKIYLLHTPFVLRTVAIIMVILILARPQTTDNWQNTEIEGTGNLDSKNGAEVMNLLTELNKEGTTIIMVTHSQHDASFAHRTVHLFDGSVVASVTA